MNIIEISCTVLQLDWVMFLSSTADNKIRNLIEYVERQACLFNFQLFLLLPRKPNKFKKSSEIDEKFVKVYASEKSAEQISKDIDRMFPKHKEGGSYVYINKEDSQVFEGISTGMVLEKGNFEWTKEELAVAKAKGIVINE